MNKDLKVRANEYFNNLSEAEKEYLTPDVVYKLMVNEEIEAGNKTLKGKNKKEFAAAETALFKTLRQILDVPSIPVKSFKSKNDEAETAVLVISDLHIGSLVKDDKGKIIYDAKIAEERFKNIIDNSIKVINRVSNITETDELVIVMVGDLVDGEVIYPTQSFHLDQSPPFQMRTFLKIFISLLKTVSPMFKRVSIYGVKGNHGRTSNDNVSEESNYDIALYTQLEFFIDELKHSANILQNVSIEYSKVEYINFKVKNWNFHARHYAPPHANSNAQQNKFRGWKEIHKCDVLVYGHWHHFGMFDVDNSMRVFKNSSLKGCDVLAEKLALTSTPGQWLFGVSKKRKTTWQYMIGV